MLHDPYYDPFLSYEENYKNGPFGVFSNNLIIDPSINSKPYNYFGNEVNLPFGIPAGPIINSNYAKAAFQKGFDIVVYKTVRTDFFPCHPFPNVLSVNIEGDLTVEKMQEKLIADANYHEPLSITNSFGVPSKKPEEWQKDVKKALEHAGEKQVLVLSFMGTVRKNQTQEEFIDDYALAAKLSLETGVKILETNLSCPNIGNEGLVCYNLDITRKVCKAIRKVIGNTPLILKVGYYKDDDQLFELAKIANEYADGVSAINTLQTEIVNKKGGQALPGINRARSGVCGATIKWAGLEIVEKLNVLRNTNNFKFTIEGVGGVTQPADYFEYIKAGADSVMSATGSMWNPYLANEIKESKNNALELIEKWHGKTTN